MPDIFLLDRNLWGRKIAERNSEVLFGVKAPSNLFSHLFINVKLSVASIEEYATFMRVYFSADEHLGLLVSILEASASIIVFLLYFFLFVLLSI